MRPYDKLHQWPSLIHLLEIIYPATNSNEQTCSLQITDSVYLKECLDKLTKCPSRRSASLAIDIQIGLLDFLNNSDQSSDKAT